MWESSPQTRGVTERRIQYNLIIWHVNLIFILLHFVLHFYLLYAYDGKMQPSPNLLCYRTKYIYI